MELRCLNKKCNNIWDYTGDKKVNAVCPDCKRMVKIPNLKEITMPNFKQPRIKKPKSIEKELTEIKEIADSTEDCLVKEIVDKATDAANKDVKKEDEIKEV